MTTCALCRRTYSQNREIQKNYKNNDSVCRCIFFPDKKDKKGKHKYKRRQIQNQTKTNCAGAPTSQTKKIKKTNTNTNNDKHETKTKTGTDKLHRCTYFQERTNNNLTSRRSTWRRQRPRYYFLYQFFFCLRVEL